MSASSKPRPGFTLVELLIVAVVLAIFAGILATQFEGTTVEAREGALDAMLSRTRAAIDRYHAQHGGNYPGRIEATVSSGCPSGGSNAAANSVEAFAFQMQFYTNAAGQYCAAQTPWFTLGPYLAWTTETENPITGTGELVVVSDGSLVLTADGPGGGFKYDTVSGKFIANDSSLDRNGVPYDQR